MSVDKKIERSELCKWFLWDYLHIYGRRQEVNLKLVAQHHGCPVKSVFSVCSCLLSY